MYTKNYNLNSRIRKEIRVPPDYGGTMYREESETPIRQEQTNQSPNTIPQSDQTVKQEIPPFYSASDSSWGVNEEEKSNQPRWPIEEFFRLLSAQKRELGAGENLPPIRNGFSPEELLLLLSIFSQENNREYDQVMRLILLLLSGVL